MIYISQIDSFRVWTGYSREIEWTDPCPAGWVRVPPPANLPEGQFAVLDGGTWEYVAIRPKAPITSTDVNQERDRRMLTGRSFSGIYVTGDETNIRNMTNLALGAQLAVMQNDLARIIPFKDGNNVVHELTPMTMLGLWASASEYVSALYTASWALKDMETIPDDYYDDSYWPAKE